MVASRKPPIECPHCGYNLRGIAGDRPTCPECGTESNRQDAEAFALRPRHTRRWYLVAFVGGVVMWLTNFVAARVAGVQESLDSPVLAWTMLGTLIAAFALGHHSPRPAWPLGATIVFAQLAGFFVEGMFYGALNSPFVVVTLVGVAVLAVASMLAAEFAFWLKNRPA